MPLQPKPPKVPPSQSPETPADGPNPPTTTSDSIIRPGSGPPGPPPLTKPTISNPPEPRIYREVEASVPLRPRPVLSNPPGVSAKIPRRSLMVDNGELPVTILEQLESAKKIASRTGQRIRKVFNRREFVKQFPQAGNDPRMAFTPNNFILDVTPLDTLTVGELRDLCLACKGHPLSIQKAMQVEGLADNVIVSLLKEELAVLQNAAK